jgi:hypothetical protein
MQPPTPISQQTPSTGHNLDYTPLTLPVSEQERSAYLANHTPDGTSSYWLWLGIGALFALVLSLMSSGWISDVLGLAGGQILLVAALEWVVLMVGIFWGVKSVIRLRQDKLIRLDRFAAANGMQFVHDLKDPGYSGMIFDEGHSRVLNEAFRLADGTEIGNYTYVNGNGKNRTTHDYGFVRIPLTRALPHMVLDAKGNNIFGRISNLPDSFGSDQTLSLEGDFDRHFTLYAPRQYERDALYVFTPDVMAALIDAGKDFDMETIDTNLFIYHDLHFDLTNQDQLNSLFAVIDRVASELRSQSKRYADERVGDRSQNIIAPQGSRLKHSFNWLVAGLVVLVIVYQVFEGFVQTLPGMQWVIIIPYVVIGLIALLILWNKRKR